MYRKISIISLRSNKGCYLNADKTITYHKNYQVINEKKLASIQIDNTVAILLT